MDLGLKDRVVFVGGSSRGIGRAIAEAFLTEGARVAISGRDEDALRRARQELETGHAERVLAWRGDLTEAGSAAAAVAAVTERWGAPEILVANVGSGSGPGDWDAPEEQWERAFRVNLFGSVALCRAALPGMMAKRRGAIVLISSIAGLEALPSPPLPYGAAKAALVHYAKGLSRRVGPSGVRVNVVAPGNVLFPGGSWERRVAEKGDEVRRYIESEVPLARFGEPAEIAGAVVFLCSERAAFVTGSVLVADGGQMRSF